METYNEHLAGSETVAVVQVSYDKKDSAAEKWAVEAGFSWLTILPTQRKASGFAKFSKSKYIPEYQLIDTQGKIIAPAGKEAIAKAVELAKESAAAE